MLNLSTKVARHRNVTGKNPSIASPGWKIMRIFVIWCKRQFFWLVGRPVCPSLFWLLVSFLWWNNSRLSVWGQPRYSQRPVCPRTAVLHCHTLSHTLSCTLSLNIVLLYCLYTFSLHIVLTHCIYTLSHTLSCTLSYTLSQAVLYSSEQNTVATLYIISNSVFSCKNQLLCTAVEIHWQVLLL